jgi:hypothetical protein
VALIAGLLSHMSATRGLTAPSLFRKKGVSIVFLFVRLTSAVGDDKQGTVRNFAKGILRRIPEGSVSDLTAGHRQRLLGFRARSEGPITSKRRRSGKGHSTVSRDARTATSVSLDG